VPTGPQPCVLATSAVCPSDMTWHAGPQAFAWKIASQRWAWLWKIVACFPTKVARWPTPLACAERFAAALRTPPAFGAASRKSLPGPHGPFQTVVLVSPCALPRPSAHRSFPRQPGIATATAGPPQAQPEQVCGQVSAWSQSSRQGRLLRHCSSQVGRSTALWSYGAGMHTCASSACRKGASACEETRGCPWCSCAGCARS
jgi:hypothetical protein